MSRMPLMIGLVAALLGANEPIPMSRLDVAPPPQTKNQEKSKVVVNPAKIFISDSEGTVRFETVEIKSVDGEIFKVKDIQSERRMINATGPLGFSVRRQEYLIYLASTLRQGEYSDNLVFFLEGTKQKDVRVPVSIKIYKDKADAQEPPKNKS